MNSRRHARQSILSSGIDSSVTPCRLRIVEPPVILRTRERVCKAFIPADPPETEAPQGVTAHV